ncbi:hypothetical protein M5K25_012305 [Dendrobium thyrsiflorum]|uniref:Uncharacterized protein n=1 Tax=Dendrobium thyrsiflorum TaxID=117978 RepID=A0ABD0UXD3_DENTH
MGKKLPTAKNCPSVYEKEKLQNVVAKEHDSFIGLIKIEARLFLLNRELLVQLLEVVDSRKRLHSSVFTAEKTSAFLFSRHPTLAFLELKAVHDAVSVVSVCSSASPISESEKGKKPVDL